VESVGWSVSLSVSQSVSYLVLVYFNIYVFSLDKARQRTVHRIRLFRRAYSTRHFNYGTSQLHSEGGGGGEKISAGLYYV
jgi:hypothetical protein